MPIAYLCEIQILNRKMKKSLLNTPHGPQTIMSDLISDHYDLLLVIMRFGIPLGFGEKTVAQVCSERGVDCNTLLTVLNALSTECPTPGEEIWEAISPSTVVDYLQRSHHYFIDYKLPSLREQLALAIAGGPEHLSKLIFKFYDEYVSEVHKHMGYEDKTVFPYVRALINNQETKEYRIQIFSRRHDKIESKITELKNILIKYYPDGTGYALTSVLHNIFATEADLASHNLIEDNLLVPLIEHLETKKR